MNEKAKLLIGKYFEEESLVESNIRSFNYFIQRELNLILEENKEIEPTIIPHNIEECKIRLDKIWVEKPEITEADGSKRKIFPIEARLRKLTYGAPVYIEISTHINGVQRESFTTQIAEIPVMLKSNFCHLHGMSKEELVEHGEDPNEQGGYFVVKGTEKVIISVEDLAPNRLIIEETGGTSKFEAKLFSEKGSYKIPHTIEKPKDSIFYLTFASIKKVPAVILLKALGLTKDDEIMKAISADKMYDDVLINLYEYADIKTDEQAIDFIAKKIGITQAKEVRIQRVQETLDKYLLPHIGDKPELRMYKAYNICKYIKKFIQTEKGELRQSDKDHYANKRLKLSGDLLADLFRVNLKVLIKDLLYNFQRIVKRGKFPSVKVIIRDKLLTSRIESAMATGTWVGGRKGIAQRLQRTNYVDTLSHLQRVISPLSTTQENFEAREIHPTHFGRLCPIETPEGTNIGLRKNLSILAEVSRETSEENVIRILKDLGLRVV